MAKMTNYNTYNANNTQEELQRLAEDIFQYGTIMEISHHGYGTNRNTGVNGAMQHVTDGGLCYIVDGLKGSNTRYWVHMQGCRVTEIIENISK